MHVQERNLFSFGLGLASVGVILFLAWSAVCMAHGGEHSFTAHVIMGVITALIILPLLVLGVRNLIRG